MLNAGAESAAAERDDGHPRRPAGVRGHGHLPGRPAGGGPGVRAAAAQAACCVPGASASGGVGRGHDKAAAEPAEAPHSHAAQMQGRAQARQQTVEIGSRFARYVVIVSTWEGAGLGIEIHRSDTVLINIP